MKIITISPTGTALALRIKNELPSCEIFTLEKYACEGTVAFNQSLSELVKQLFVSGNKLIFIMATGIVVRSIAPCIEHKANDPAVVVVDECGQFAISLLSGHLGGANELCRNIANLLGAIPVVTTASDLHGKMAVDSFAQLHGFIIDDLTAAKQVTALLLNNKNIQLRNETICATNTPYSTTEIADALIVVTHRRLVESTIPYSKLLAKNIVIGVGCRKDVAGEAIIAFIEQKLAEMNIDSRCIAGFASVDIKANEAGIHQAAQYFSVSVSFINRADIALVESQFASSAFVKEQIGVSGVCEPAAYLAAQSNGRFLLRKCSQNGITLAFFEQGK